MYKTDAVIRGGGNARGVQNTRGNVRPPTSWRSRRLSANSDQPSCCIVVVTLLLRPQVGRCSIDISTDTSDCYPRATLQASAGTSVGFVTAAVSMPMGGCRAIRVGDDDVSLVSAETVGAVMAAEPAVL